MENNWGTHDMLVKCSFRYCLGRKSYIVWAFIDWMKGNWDSFHPQTKGLIVKEIYEALDEGKCQPDWTQVLEWGKYIKPGLTDFNPDEFDVASNSPIEVDSEPTRKKMSDFDKKKELEIISCYFHKAMKVQDPLDFAVAQRNLLWKMAEYFLHELEELERVERNE